MSNAENIADLLITLNLNLTLGTNLFIGKEAFDAENSIIIFDIGSGLQSSKLNYDLYNIVIRAKYNTYTDGYNKLYEIRNKLIGKSPVTINNIDMRGFWITSDIASVGFDDEDEAVFDMHVKIMYIDNNNNINRN